MGVTGTIISLIPAVLGAVGGIAGASKGPGSSQLAGGARAGGFQYQPTTRANPEDQMRLSEMLRLTGQ